MFFLIVPEKKRRGKSFPGIFPDSFLRRTVVESGKTVWRWSGLNERTKKQVRLPGLPGRPWAERLRILLPCLVRFGCGFLFTGASFRGQCLPLGLCLLTVPGPGLQDRKSVV